MRILLDTHAFLWFVLGDPQLSAVARAYIVDPAHIKFVSPASYWEIAIKIATGKYALNRPFDDFVRHGIEDNGFEVLPIEIQHAALLTNMPFHHRDPFDRLLVAQALVEQMPIVSGDAILDSYGVTRIW